MHDFKVSWSYHIPSVYYFLKWSCTFCVLFLEVIIYLLCIISCSDLITLILAQVGNNFFCDVNPIVTNTSASHHHPLAEKMMAPKFFLFSSDLPESDQNNTESMQHVTSYLHEDLSLPTYNKTSELSFEDVFNMLT